uniref:Sphingomyelin phosphodiesterase 3 n=1 Tax=Sphaeramia orbicularis TaxID=375764 RepID=A0A672Z2B1_9TELE
LPFPSPPFFFLFLSLIHSFPPAWCSPDWLLDRLLASCVATSLEKRQRSQDPCSFLTLCVLVSAPLRSVSKVKGRGDGEWRPQGFNNLSDTHRRAREVGKRIRNGASRPQIKIYIDSPTNTSIRYGAPGYGDISNNTLSHVPRTSIFKRPGRKRRHGDETFDHEISAFFPANLDFLALQEVFDHGSTTRLRHQLHRYFPYVLSDVGQYGWKSCCSSFKFLNSGLMLASRYPILDARFECYPNGRGEDALAAKGRCSPRSVHVGTSHQEQRVVGYITCTHLHAIEGDAAVRCEQLDLLLQWGAEFRQASSRQPEGEKVFEDLVAFDVVLGDLNFDNCSSGTDDKLEQQHALFTQYKDPCRLGPGEDKPWALGNYTTTQLHNDTMTLVMENEEGRKEYLVFPPSKSQCPGSSQKGRKIPLKGNGRRIDYILYSDEGLNQDWKLDIEEFSFVTQLAGLTDHLSVAMRLSVATGDDEP